VCWSSRKNGHRSRPLAGTKPPALPCRLAPPVGSGRRRR
jgi:hypothetical protein